MNIKSATLGAFFYFYIKLYVCPDQCHLIIRHIMTPM